MKKCARLFVFLGCLLVLSAGTAFAEQDLDEGALRESVAARVNLILAERSPETSSPITVDAITVEQVQPVLVGKTPLYAVKVSLRAGGSAKEIFTEPEEMIILTDKSGTVQFGMVTAIATGDEAAMVQASSLTQVAFPSHLAKEFINGTGQKDVVIVTDPFCPYCRQALNFLSGKLSQIATLKLVHLPLAMHPGAEAAAWIMEFAREEAADFYRQVVGFAYDGLKAPAGEDGSPAKGDDAQRDVIRQFLEKFPKLTILPLEPFLYYLKEKYEPQDHSTRQELRKLRITGTPVVVIDGQAIHGFDQKEIENRLNK